MKKFAALLLGLAMAAFNAMAAVNVNTATQEQLETLNGIGPSKAKAIIDYRTKNGPFKTVEDLDKVPGIGEGVIGKIKSDVTLTGATTVKAEAKPEPKAGAKKAEAKPEAKAEAKPETKTEAKPAAKAETKPAAKAEAKPEAKAEAKPAAKAEAKPAAKAEAPAEKK